MKNFSILSLVMFLFFTTTSSVVAEQVDCSKFNMMPVVANGGTLQMTYQGEDTLFKAENNTIYVYQNGRLIASFEPVGFSMQKRNCQEY